MSEAERAVVRNERVLAARAAAIFRAFERPELLAQWWGPKGFTNTFSEFAFQPGGRWIFVMHGPNGANYPNESAFREIVPGRKIVIEHRSEPQFTLTVVLEELGEGTRVSWEQAFVSADVAEKLRPLVEPANEQNLDRLQALLAREVE